MSVLQSIGAKRRWEKTSEIRALAMRERMAGLAARCTKRALVKDLRLLRSVIRAEATRIRVATFPERNRVHALAAYHAGGFKRHLRTGLETAMRRVVRDENRPAQELQRLAEAAHEISKKFFKKQARGVKAKLIRTLRRRLENSMINLKAGKSKSKTARDLLGCDLDVLKFHLEKQFRPGMNWANHGFKGWHVDHRIPLAAFNLSDPEQQKHAFHFSNLQPLWWRDNLIKRDKICCAQDNQCAKVFVC